MSEYQYYEFQAVDRPLTEREMQELRYYSSRATITSTRFVNEYHWGSFKGNPSAWMEKYFDAFLYLANWGTHELMLRLPRRALDLATAQRYLKGEAASARAKGESVILEFRSEDEKGGGWVEDDEGSGWMSSAIAVRAELASGDLRDLGSRSRRSAEVQDRIQRIRDEHAKKPSFVERLQRAGLIAPGADGARRPQPLAPVRKPR